MSKESKKKRRYIKKHYLYQTDGQLAAHLGLSKDEVRGILDKLGLKRADKKAALTKEGAKASAQGKRLKVRPKVRILFLALIVLMGIVIYSNTFKNELVWDDHFLIKDNLFIRQIKFLPQIFTTDLHRFGSERSNFYRPLQTLSYMLDYAIGKFNPWPYHLSSLLLHLLSGVLIYFIVLRLCKNEIISFLSAFIFVAHPVQTETVTYLSDRADLLAATFIFGGFLAFLHYSSRPRFSALLGFNLCFILALLSKEIAIIFPLIIFIWAGFSGDKKEKPSLKAPYISLAVISAAYIFLRLSFLHFKGNTFGLSPNEVFSIRFLTMLKALWRYFVLLIYPRHLYMERNFPWVRSLAEPAAWAGIAIIAASVFLAKVKFRRQRYLSFAVAFFYISLFPMLNIIPVNAIMSEHWLYLPSFGFALILAAFIFRLYQYRSVGLKAFLSLLLAANFSFYAYRTITRNSEWRNEETLFYATLRYQPNSSRVYYNLGNVYAHRAEYETAIENYLRAAELQQDYAEAWCNMGLANFKLGKADLAIEQYHQALKHKPDLASAHNNLALALDDQGQQEQAKREYEQAIACDPDYAEPHNGLGVHYAKKGQLDKAVLHFQEALKIKPGFTDAINNLNRAKALMKLQ